MDLKELKRDMDWFISEVDELEVSQLANKRNKSNLERDIQEIMERNKHNKEAVEIAIHAVEIIRQVSDELVGEAYKFLEANINKALEQMFKNSTRKIQIKEWSRGQYPQLHLDLDVGNGIIRSLKTDSGHGIAQIISLLSILTLIVVTGSRRFVAIDEIVSGLSRDTRMILNDVLWTFTTIGFQFLCNEHGFVPKGARVYHLQSVGDVSTVKRTYIERKGVYLDIAPQIQETTDTHDNSSEREYEEQEQEQTKEQPQEQPQEQQENVISI